MTDRVTVGNLRVAQVLYDFITNEALPGTDIDPDSFWAGVDKVVTDLSPQNQDLLARRDDLQAQIDKYHRQHVIEPIDPDGVQAVPHRHRLPAARAGRLHHHHRRGRRRDHHDRGSAAGGADPQRAIRAQRRQRPLGFAVRRAVRHRRDPVRTTAPRRAPAITQCAATRSSPTRGSSSTARFRWPPARGARRPGSRSARRTGQVSS